MPAYGVTGHRYILEHKPGDLLKFARLIVFRMTEEGATEIITGMAQGWDMAVALACVEGGVPFIAALPFPQQADKWHPVLQDQYARLIQSAKAVVVTGKMPLNHNYHKRDRFIVDSCVELWSLCDGRPGGTSKTVLYAHDVGRSVVSLWSQWLAFRQRSK